MSSISGIGTGQQGVGMLTAASGSVEVEALKQDGTSEVAATVHQDAATLTSLSSLMAQAVSGSDTNAAKVEALREAIATGTYAVPAAAVADKLIESMER